MIISLIYKNKIYMFHNFLEKDLQLCRATGHSSLGENNPAWTGSSPCPCQVGPRHVDQHAGVYCAWAAQPVLHLKLHINEVFITFKQCLMMVGIAYITCDRIG